MPTLGLDIGGTRIKAALLDGETVLATFVTQRYRRPDRDTLLRAVDEAVQGIQDATASPEGEAAPSDSGHGLPFGTSRGTRASFDAVGISVPGLLSDDQTRVLFSANVPGLQDIHLPDLWQNIAPGGTVMTDQIATATDYAAAADLRGRVLAIAIGTGVGAAVLDCSDEYPLGIPLRVNGDSPGHLGQIDVSLSDDPPIGPDGGAGSLEAYLGAGALGEIDPATLMIDHTAMRALVRTLRICHALYRPNHIALLGGIGIRLTHLAEPLYARVSDRLTKLARPGWKIGFGTDDFHAARGAARRAGERRQ